MRELLAVYGVDAISAGELKLPEPEETGTTFRANARIKADAAAKASNMPAFADDSGLVVDALDGDPGIHSARWAGPDNDFRFAMNKIQSLLVERGAKTAERRRGHFVSALCVAWPDGHFEEFELHFRNALLRTKVPLEQLRELMLHISQYCGQPTGAAIWKISRRVLKEEKIDLSQLKPLDVSQLYHLPD